MAVEELRVMGRATQGVRLISLRGKDAIAAVCKVPKSDEEDITDETSEEMSDDHAGGSNSEAEDSTGQE